MLKYSDYSNAEITEANSTAVSKGNASGFISSGGVTPTQHTYVNVAQNDEKTITHTSDTSGQRIVQIQEFVPSVSGVTNTTLDFDLADENSFIQEDSVSGTDFVAGVVKLHGVSDGTTNTMDPNSIGSTVVLSNGNLTVDIPGTNQAAFAAASANSGKWYFEVTIEEPTNTSSPANFEFGISAMVGDFDSRPAVDQIAYYALGYIYRDGSYAASGLSECTIGDVIGVAVDLDLNTITFYKNGPNVIWTGAHNITSAAYAYILAGGNEQKVTFNFGASSFTGTVPEGYSSGFGAETSYPLTPKYLTTSDSNHIPLSNITTINSCSITNTTPANTDLGVLVSFDGRSTWKYWSGTEFTTHTGLSTKTGWNTANEIDTAFTNYSVVSGVNNLDFAFLLETSDANSTPEIDQVTLNYNENGVYVIASESDYKASFITSTSTTVKKLSADTVDSIKINVLL